MPEFNWKVLENFPLLMYILAAKTLLLCLAFAGAKIYQRRRVEAKLKLEQEEQLRKKKAEKEEAEKKDD
ncbi:small integral membrane protein 11 [Hyla sarda]|uniref:small integral membrane protein 11 n=1 Tax=Hyla sarda TaxID=327740 RepID=UPI0024C2801C|nr:small integral membrane protein 11 [Hyla sarda]XP_056415547.1 small integral membrane protein 11 [Hyla sarda]